MAQTEATHENPSEATTRSVGVQRLVMRLRRYNEWRRGADYELLGGYEVEKQVGGRTVSITVEWRPLPTLNLDELPD